MAGTPYAVWSENHNSVGLEVYQREVLEIWPQLIERPALHTWLQVVEHATSACEGVRRNDWRVVLDEIGKTIVWWLAFIEKLNHLVGDEKNDELVFALPWNATEIVWSKYPGICPVEFGIAMKSLPELPTWDLRPGKICECMSRKRQVEERTPEEKAATKELVRAFARANDSQRPSSIANIETLLRDTFESPCDVLQPGEISLHFIEEVGEVSKALAHATTSQVATSRPLDANAFLLERQTRASGIAEELADVFSWAVTFISKVKSELLSFENYFDEGSEVDELKNIRAILAGTRSLNVADIIWRRYGSEGGGLQCDVCGHRPCSCTEQAELPLHSSTLDDELRIALVAAQKGVT